MQTITTLENLDGLIRQEEALFILWGGQACNVCQTIKTPLSDKVKEHYPNLKQVYVDCQETTEVCAQKGILSLPTVQVYFTGQKFVEKVRTFSLQQVVDDIKRPYEMCFDA